jgi:hypothetical protein
VPHCPFVGLDQDLKHGGQGLLRWRQGHRGALLREVLRIRSIDPVVIAKAQELDAILISLNGDFADIVAYPPGNYRVVTHHSPDHRRSAFTLVRLPVGR